MTRSFWRRQVYEYHPVLGWWHLPSLYARLPLGQTYHRLTTNSVGMRSDRDYPKKCPDGRRRIIFLGDSYTAGDGVSNGQRFTDLLEQRFPSLDALNFGLNGSGTDQQLLIYETVAAEYEADAYVFCICIENIARNLYHCFPSYDWREQQVAYRPKPYFDFDEGGLILRNVPVPRERRLADELRGWNYGFPYFRGDPDPYAIYKDPESVHWKIMKAILGRFLNKVRGAPVFIVPMPMYQHYLEEHAPNYLQRFGELANPVERVHVVNLLPAMLAVPLEHRRRFRFPDDPHYTAAAHSLVADALEYQLANHVSSLLD